MTRHIPLATAVFRGLNSSLTLVLTLVSRADGRQAMARKKESRRSQGTGSIFFDKTLGLWTAQVLVGQTEKGRPKYAKASRRTETEAVKELNRMMADHTLGLTQALTKQTVGEFLDYWLEQCVKPHREPKTYRTYEQIVRLYLKPELGHFPLAKLRPPQIQAAINRLAGKRSDDPESEPLSPKTVRDARGVLRSALNTAWRDGSIRENPALKVETPKVEQGEAVYLSVEEAAKLVAKSRSHSLGPMIEVTIMTGLRLGEATGLTWADIDFENSVVRVRQQLQHIKGKPILKGLKSRSSKRTLSLPKEGMDALAEQRSRQILLKASLNTDGFNPLNLVFTNAKGEPLGGPNVDDSLKSLCKLAEIKEVSFHKLRHTAATHLAASGVPLVVVKDVMGHSAIGLTANLYSHAVPTALKDAGEKLGQLLRDAAQQL